MWEWIFDLGPRCGIAGVERGGVGGGYLFCIRQTPPEIKFLRDGCFFVFHLSHRLLYKGGSVFVIRCFYASDNEWTNQSETFWGSE